MNKIIKKRKINILYVMDYYYSPFGGTESQLYTLISNLDKDKFYTELCLLRKFTFDPNYFQKETFPCKINLINFEKFRRFHDWINLLKLRKYIKENKFDIVQILFNDAALCVPFICMGLNIKIITCRRDMGFWYTNFKLAMLRFNRLFVDLYLVNSESVKKNVIEKEKVKKRKIWVIYNGHESNRFMVDKCRNFHRKMGIPEKAKIVGIVANYRPVKRIDDLIKAFLAVANKVDDCYLVLVGDFYDKKQKCVELTERLGINKRVRFIGKVDDVIPLIKNFTIGVNCSESEGLSNVIIEYMGCEIPIVCTRTSGNSELIEHEKNGILYEIGDVRGLSASIIKMLEYPERCNRLVKNAKYFASKKFDKDMIIRKYEKTYDYLAMNREKIKEAN